MGIRARPALASLTSGLMSRRPKRFSSIHDDGRFLASLSTIRNEVVRAQSGLEIKSEAYKALDRFRGEIDLVVELVTGDSEALWAKPGRIGKNG